MTFRWYIIVELPGTRHTAVLFCTHVWLVKCSTIKCLKFPSKSFIGVWRTWVTFAWPWRCHEMKDGSHMVSVHGTVATLCSGRSNWRHRVLQKKARRTSDIPEISPHFVEPKELVPCSKRPATFPYPEPDQSSSPSYFCVMNTLAHFPLCRSFQSQDPA